MSAVIAIRRVRYVPAGIADACRNDPVHLANQLRHSIRAIDQRHRELGVPLGCFRFLHRALREGEDHYHHYAGKQ